MAKKQSFLSKIGLGVKTGAKRTGEFVEHEKEAFSKFKKDFRKSQVKRHQTKLKEQRKHFKEEFETLSEQHAIEQLKTDVEMERQQHKTSVAQLRLQREQLRTVRQEMRPRGTVGATVKEIFLPSREQIAQERGAIPQKPKGLMAQYREDNKAILAQIDARAKKIR